MHVAYLCADRGVPVDGTKGASIHVRAVAQALAGRGHRVTVLAACCGRPPAGFTPELVEFGYDRTLKRLKAAVAEAGEPQLGREVYALGLNARLAEALEAVDRRRPVEAVYERYSLWSWAGLRFARRRGVPLLLEVNAPLVAEQARWRHLELTPVARALEGQLMVEADAVVVPSEELAEWVRREMGRERPTRVLPNGFDEALFSRPRVLPAAAGMARRGRFVVAFVGSLKPWHGVGPLLEAFERLRSRVPAAHLLVVGDGPLRPAVEAARRRLGAEAITLAGAVDHHEVPGWLALADVGVAPYPLLERFYFSPLKVVEYQAAGLPVVASRVGQLERLVTDGETGRLVEPGDAAALAAALAELARQPELRRRLGERARRRAFRSSGWRRTAAEIEKLIEGCRSRPETGWTMSLGEAS